MIAARYNSKAMIKIHPPFVVFDEENNYLQQAQEAFNRANTQTIGGDFE